MRIAPISINLYKNNYNVQSQTPVKAAPPPTDMFVSNIDTVSFSARLDERFPKKFLKEILSFGLPCPVCEKPMIPLERLSEPATETLKFFAPHLDEMTPMNKTIYSKMSELAPQHPDKNIQGLLEVMYPEAEKALILEQREVLDSLNFLSRELPPQKGEELRKIIGSTFEEIFKPEVDTDKRFKRKRTIAKFDKLAKKVKEKELAAKIVETIRKLPTSDTSENAYIVKYAVRDPENIGMKMFADDFATLEHIIPESQGGSLVIWECSADNAARGAISINNQHALNPNMAEHFQKHITRLIEIHDNEWQNFKTPNAKSKIKEYIFSLKNEIFIASNGKINLDISGLKSIPAMVIRDEIIRIKGIKNPRFNKVKKICTDELCRLLPRKSSIT
ncbi:MAG: hypothetical protein NC390_00380 [Fusobacterium sp.]|nr:hypothetical protein [Fusobacterium sp.]